MPRKQAEQLIELLSRSALALKVRFESVALPQFWLNLSGEICELKLLGIRLLVKFGSSCVFKSAFSTMNAIKKECR